MFYVNRFANCKGLLAVVTTVVTFASTVSLPQDTQSPDTLAPPPLLSDTGLFVTGSATEIRDGISPYSPQYTLWSDEATKRRWLYLPPDTFIDGSDPDHWAFPPGTRLWKEFSQAGRRIETRFIERRTDGIWQFATYAWNEDNIPMYKHFVDADIEAIYTYLRTIPAISNEVPEPWDPPTQDLGSNQ